jgi:predicted nuclease of predicted toxin-antitoxin system
MRLTADEMVPRAAVEKLRQRGHDVTWIRESAPGSSDEQVLEDAAAEGRVILTFDTDFGELVFARGLGGAAGVVLFRVMQPSPEATADAVIRILESRDDWEGHFSVVDRTRIRMRPLDSRG